MHRLDQTLPPTPNTHPARPPPSPQTHRGLVTWVSVSHSTGLSLEVRYTHARPHTHTLTQVSVLLTEIWTNRLTHTQSLTDIFKGRHAMFLFFILPLAMVCQGAASCLSYSRPWSLCLNTALNLQLGADRELFAGIFLFLFTGTRPSAVRSSGSAEAGRYSLYHVPSSADLRCYTFRVFPFTHHSC